MGRDWRVDTLRGYFLFLMTLAHLPEEVLLRLAEYFFGFASAPDGFVFLSGMTTAWVYLRVRNKRGPSAMRAKALRRTGDIYFTHMLLLSLAIIAGARMGAASVRSLHPLLTLLSGSLFLYQPRMLDILPMYCIFFLCIPLTLEAMMRGKAWLVGVISGAMWLAAQCGVGDAVRGVTWIDLGAFNVLAWQGYFIAGQYIGYRRVAGKTVVPKSRRLLALCAAIALLLFEQRHFGLVTASWLQFVGGPDHNPVRFLDAACLGYLVWWVPRSLDERLKVYRLFQMFNYLGQHSLQVFAWSIALTTTMVHFRAYFWNPFSPMGRVAVAVLAGLTLVIPAWLHQLYRQRRSGKPIVLATYHASAGDEQRNTQQPLMPSASAG
jgi:hypothetical protein